MIVTPGADALLSGFRTIILDEFYDRSVPAGTRRRPLAPGNRRRAEDDDDATAGD
jgi:hypothetical protein